MSHALPSRPADALPRSAVFANRCFARRSADGSHGEKKWEHHDGLPRRSAELIALPPGNPQPAKGCSEVTPPWHGGFLAELGGQSVSQPRPHAAQGNPAREILCHGGAP